MQTTDNAATISAFLLRHIKLAALKPEEDIFAAGYVNSLFALQLVTFVETSFGIRIEDEDLDIANFRSIAAIDAFVRRKTSGREASS